MKVPWLNAPTGQERLNARPSRGAAKRRIAERQARKEEQPDDGLRRFLKADPAVEETMRRAGLD
ncbi:hypothetical protein [Mesorhizobium sp. M7A.F.Ca.ET.027.03.2.1]|uniref:hypothetical protein n=1 Tax=Mesorhizobium sp. M7A.F.Ca.ET.027.03.2.1 TaxID=2496656 RepID=UPI0011AE19CB|nr:hypothetical protein [Mesorhizobium sp. M7A.F.Ca.ET.027.03.2.1]